MRLYLAFFVGLSFALPVAAKESGTSGYLRNGKVVVTHKDGVELAKKEREPANFNQGSTLDIIWQDDGIARCYYMPGSTQDVKFFQCVKK